MKILYKFASRERPEKFFKCLDNIHSLAKHDNFQIVASFDIDDKSMIGDEIKNKLSAYSTVVPYWGDSHKRKIFALNRDISFINDWDILIVTADDFWFEKPGFDLDIIEDVKSNPDCLLHYPDGHANERLITMPIMDRKYYERFNYVYHPSYCSVYADNEQMEVAKKLGKHRFINKRLFTHKNPIWGYEKPDALFRHTENADNYKIDGNLFRERQKHNFYI